VRAEFPTVGTPDAPAALSADIDLDGLSNLGEYAFCRNPRVSDNDGLAKGSLVPDGGINYLAVTFTRRHKALDLTYIVEVSDDLATWTPVDLPVGAPAMIDAGVEQVTYRDEQPAGAGHRFLRVRAVK